MTNERERVNLGGRRTGEQPGDTALRHYGIKALYHSGIPALQHYGIAALRHYGIKALRHYGVVTYRQHGVKMNRTRRDAGMCPDEKGELNQELLRKEEERRRSCLN